MVAKEKHLTDMGISVHGKYIQGNTKAMCSICIRVHGKHVQSLKNLIHTKAF
jgi:hypothetical protein